VLEQVIGKPVRRELAPMQSGDVSKSYADIEAASGDFGFHPRTKINEDLPRFVTRYRLYNDL
jgi:UDP-glucuronate 4-epimerase